MKKYIAPLLFSLLATAACTPKNSALTKEEVIAAIKHFDAGWNNKNIAAVDSVLAPGYVYFTQSGSTFSRDSVVATAGSPAYQLEQVIRTDYEVLLYGNTAIVSTRWQGKGMYKGTPFNEDQRCSITLVKKGNTVEILSEHCTPIKPAVIFH
jgi:ketosteroid isomerase-like protein